MLTRDSGKITCKLFFLNSPKICGEKKFKGYYYPHKISTNYFGTIMKKKKKEFEFVSHQNDLGGFKNM